MYLRERLFLFLLRDVVELVDNLRKDIISISVLILNMVITAVVVLSKNMRKKGSCSHYIMVLIHQRHLSHWLLSDDIVYRAYAMKVF
jgi:hypothetical protein